jgi:hypothetical protein
MAAIEQCYDGVNQEMEEADSVLRKYNTKRG